MLGREQNPSPQLFLQIAAESTTGKRTNNQVINHSLQNKKTIVKNNKPEKLRYKICDILYTMEYYSAIKRNEIELFVVRWMDLESVIQSEVSQKEKDKYRMLTRTYGI